MSMPAHFRRRQLQQWQADSIIDAVRHRRLSPRPPAKPARRRRRRRAPLSTFAAGRVAMQQQPPAQPARFHTPMLASP